MSVNSTKLLEFSIETGQDSPLDAQGDYPVLMPMNLELLLHAKALQILFAGEQPLMVPLRPTDKGKLRFFVGDASQEGFGRATRFPDTTVAMRKGLWYPDFAKGGSNLREAQNQVNHLLGEILMGKNDGGEVWAALVWSAI